MAFECGDDHQTKLSQNRNDLIQAEHSESSIPEAARREYDHFRIEVREDGTLFELGRGAMGVTYKALDVNLHRFVALKVISPTCVSDDSTRQRFVREARAAASLRHEHIASVYHLGSTGSNYFYAMEFVEGQTLEQILRSSGRLPKGLALEITSQAAAALAAAHQHQLVHRDIKPANLIISFDEKNRPTLKVIDFGLVKVSTEVSGDSSVSVPGIFMGTPHYASPEQFIGGQVDSRSDIYSLGITLWQMLTNATPFSGSPAQVAAQHLQAPLPLSELRHLPHPVV
jgi:serine/threonine protein kinase